MKLYWPVRVEDGAFPGQKFGEHLVDYSQYGLKGHDGQDFIIRAGKPVYASHDGDLTDNATLRGLGNYVMIHGDGFTTYYGHLSAFVGGNRKVKAGELIGKVGSTGFSTGPHLHFSLRFDNYDINNGYKGCVDPMPYLAAESEKPMGQFKTQNYKGELRIVLQADSQQTWEALCKVYNVDPKIINEEIK